MKVTFKELDQLEAEFMAATTGKEYRRLDRAFYAVPRKTRRAWLLARVDS
ncbi:MAG: hypothetical protein ABSA21_08415 [Candidatus Limnocylindrales bacterium]|jgi:hypothetical protein